MRVHLVLRLLCLYWVAGLTAAPLVCSQQTGSSTAASPSSSTTATPGYVPLSDYVPCLFKEDDEFGMRARDPQKPLDKASAEQLYNAVDSALQAKLALYNAQNDVFARALRNYFHTKLDSSWLPGKTREQALAQIRAVLYNAVTENAHLIKGDLHSDDETQKAKDKVALRLSEEVGKAAEEVAARAAALDTARKAPTQSEIALAMVNAGRNSISQPLADLPLNANYRNDVLEQYRKLTQETVSQFQNQDTLAYNRAPRKEDLQTAAEQAAQLAKGYPFSGSTLNPSDTIAALQQALADATEEAVRAAQPKQYQPPPDVSCSMAVMSWKETSDIFGRRVANTFVAVQVTLRNLNTKNEFLVHDIQVAVDTGVTPDYFGRFQAGRDKLLVRAVAQRGQSSDRRNIVLNVLQTVGALGAAASLTAGTAEFKDAVAVFQGAFIPGFTNIFPDHTVEQLNHINDLVFSASNTAKVLVPVQGSVPLVTFISEKPIEQLPFAWCGHPPQSHFNPERWVGWGPEQLCDFNGGKRDAGYVTQYRYTKHGKQQPKFNEGPLVAPTAPTPVDKTLPPVDETLTPEQQKQKLQEAKEKIAADVKKYNDDKAEYDAFPQKKETQRANYPLGPTVKPVQDSNYNEVPFEDGLPPWNDLAYRHWKGAAVRMLQEHTYVVVGGVHIQEIATQPRAASLSCPQLKTGPVDLSQTQDAQVNCTITGTGLNLISAVNLQKADSKVPGTIKPASDGNSATLQFKPEELCSKEGDYSLFVTYKSDTQKEAAPLDTGDKVSLKPQPAISGTHTLVAGKLTLNGSCMDKFGAVSLVENSTTLSGGELAPDDRHTQLTATFKDKNVTKSGATYSIQYTIAGVTDPVIPKPPVTVTDTTKASPSTTDSAPKKHQKAH